MFPASQYVCYILLTNYIFNYYTKVLCPIVFYFLRDTKYFCVILIILYYI